jgi:hypothetical protein
MNSATGGYQNDQNGTVSNQLTALEIVKSVLVVTVNLLMCDRAVAKFLVPDLGDKVDSGIELSYRPTRLHRLVVPVR